MRHACESKSSRSTVKKVTRPMLIKIPYLILQCKFKSSYKLSGLLTYQNNSTLGSWNVNYRPCHTNSIMSPLTSVHIWSISELLNTLSELIFEQNHVFSLQYKKTLILSSIHKCFRTYTGQEATCPQQQQRSVPPQHREKIILHFLVEIDFRRKLNLLLK